MKIFQLLLITSLSLFIFACGGTETSLKFETTAYVFNSTTGSYEQEANSTEVPADGKSYVEIKAKVTSVNGEVFNGREITFTTTNGVFKTKETDPGLTEIIVKSKSSAATIRLYSTTAQVEANVEATFDDTAYDGKVVTESLTIKFGNLVAGSKLSACHFEITCAAKNLGALTDHNIATECFVKTENRKQLHVDVPNIEFKMETGKMITIPGETAADNRYFYIADPIKRPVDVEPLTVSGNFGGSCSDDCKNNNDLIERCKCGLQGETLNPRDSLVTIIAYANGEECFEDLNSNNNFDSGEKIYGNFLGEPFVDSNDNAKRDSDEQYVESFGNPNEYDEEEGAWNDDIQVWTQTKILLTGVPHEDGEENTRFETESGSYVNWENQSTIPNLTCGDGNKLTFYFFLYDSYLNPIATNENESTMIIEMGGNDINEIYNQENAKLNFNIDKYGFEMDEKGKIIKFNDKDDDNGMRYTAIVESKASEKDCDAYLGNEEYSVKVTINTYPGISNEYYPFEGEERTNVEKSWEFVGEIH